MRIQYFALLCACLLMSACGKKGPVEPLEKSKYPRIYPKSPPLEDEASEKKPKKKESPNEA